MHRRAPSKRSLAADDEEKHTAEGGYCREYDERGSGRALVRMSSCRRSARECERTERDVATEAAGCHEAKHGVEPASRVLAAGSPRSPEDRRDQARNEDRGTDEPEQALEALGVCRLALLEDDLLAGDQSR